MRLTPPTIPVFLISIVLAGVAIVDIFWHIPSVHSFIAGHQHRLWIIVTAYVILAVGVIFPGL